MFARSAQTILAIVLFFVVFAAASPAPVPQANSCNTGPLQCCNSLQSTNDNPGLSALLAVLGVVLDPINALVGVGCSPITVGAGQSGCNTSPVCCTNNNVGGLLSLGCAPVIL